MTFCVYHHRLNISDLPFSYLSLSGFMLFTKVVFASLHLYQLRISFFFLFLSFDLLPFLFGSLHPPPKEGLYSFHIQTSQEGASDWFSLLLCHKKPPGSAKFSSQATSENTSFHGCFGLSKNWWCTQWQMGARVIWVICNLGVSMLCGCFVPKWALCVAHIQSFKNSPVNLLEAVLQ